LDFDFLHFTKKLWEIHTVKYCGMMAKVEIVEPEKMSIARQGLGKQVSAATDAQATIKELLGTMFSVRSVHSG
jgi:hypothetical protein